MVSVNDTAVVLSTQRPPVVDQLEAVFTSLDDSALLAVLEGSTRRGPKGHPVETLWRCFITKYVLGMESTAELIRTLHNNPYIAHACGINSADAVPHNIALGICSHESRDGRPVFHGAQARCQIENQSPVIKPSTLTAAP